MTIRERVRNWLDCEEYASAVQLNVLAAAVADTQKEIAELKKRKQEPLRIRAAAPIDWDTAQVIAARDLEKEN